MAYHNGKKRKDMIGRKSMHKQDINGQEKTEKKVINGA